MSKIDGEETNGERRKGGEGKERRRRGSHLGVLDYQDLKGKKKTILNVLRTFACLSISLFILNSFISYSFYDDED